MECGQKLASPTSRSSDQQSSNTQAERRQLTVLFCDLVGSTALSDRLDAEEYRQVILDYQKVAVAVIRRFGGHIAQYLGDGLLVYFGYPKGQEDAPRAAILAGLDIIHAVCQANIQWKAEGKTAIEIRIGIHTGLVVVDDFLALGDTMNIAARLEGQAPTNGLVISARTMLLTKGWFDTQSLGKVALKGIKEPMELFQVLQESGARSRMQAVRKFGLSPIVGREEEQRLLMEQWESAKRGAGRLVFLSGEAGIGKSRLLEYMKQEIEPAANTWVVELFCGPYFQHSPFCPVVDLIEKEMLQIDKQANPEEKRQKLRLLLAEMNIPAASAFAVLAELLNISFLDTHVQGSLSQAELKRQTIAALIQLLWKKQGDRNLLLILEDLHWADPSTLEWVDAVLSQLPQRPVLILCTARPSYQPSWQNLAHVQWLQLKRLSPEHVAMLSEYQTQGKSLPVEVLEQIQAKTDGIPLFVEELSRMVVESEWVAEEADHFRLSKGAEAIKIPATLQDSLMARLDRLPEAKETIQIGAVLGREFSFDLLQAAAQKGTQELAYELGKLIESGLLFQTANSPQARYLFKHALIQDTAYQSLLRSKRQQLHERVAQLLESRFPQLAKSQPELLAHHLSRAGQSQKAIVSWTAAARHANSCCASQESIQHIEHALALLPKIPDLTERALKEYELLMFLSDVVFIIHGFSHPSVQRLNHRIIQLATQLGKSREAGLAQLGLLGHEYGAGNYQLDQPLEEIRMLAVSTKDDFLLAACESFWGSVHYMRGLYPTANIHIESALMAYDPEIHGALANQFGNNVNVETLCYFSVVLQTLGYTEQAKEMWEQSYQLAHEVRGVMNLTTSAAFGGEIGFMRKEYQWSYELNSDALTLHEDNKEGFQATALQMYVLIALGLQGDKQAAVEACQYVQKYVESFQGNRGFLLSNLAEAFRRLGESEQGLQLIEEALTKMNQTGEGHGLPEVYRIKGELLLANQAADAEVESAYRHALNISRQQSAKWFELLAAKSLARLWQSQAKKAEAYELLHGVYSWFTEGVDTVDMQETRELLEELRN